MTDNLNSHLEGLESIIHNIYQNKKIAEYLLYNIHNDEFNLNNNLGLYWILKSIIESSILDFYKLLTVQEKYSFQKIINLSKSENIQANYSILEKKNEELNQMYNSLDYDYIRSKWIAHQDLSLENKSLEYKTFFCFSNNIINFFKLLSEELGYLETRFNTQVFYSFKQIFETINKYDNLKALFLFKKLHGNNTIDLDEVKKIISE